MGWMERLGRAIRAQVNSLIREAEDPEKLLETAINEMEQQLIQMRQALAEAIATQKRTERQIHQQQKAAQTWHDRAQLALTQGNEALAKEALVKWQTYRSQIQPFQSQVEQHTSIIKKLKQELLQIEQKYAEAKAKKSLYLARLRSAAASQRIQEIMGDLQTDSSLNVFEKMESKVLEMESQLELMKAEDPLENQFMAIEGGKQVETELAKMKAQQQKPTELDPEIEKMRSEIDQL